MRFICLLGKKHKKVIYIEHVKLRKCKEGHKMWYTVNLQELGGIYYIRIIQTGL